MKAVLLTVRATSEGLRSIALTHDQGGRSVALALLQDALPALSALDRDLRASRKDQVIETVIDTALRAAGDAGTPRPPSPDEPRMKR